MSKYVPPQIYRVEHTDTAHGRIIIVLNQLKHSDRNYKYKEI